MNRAIAAGVMLCAIGWGSMVSAQEKSLAILKASAPGTKSEGRTISAEQLQQIYERRRLSPQKLFEGSNLTDLDTIQNIDSGNWISTGTANEPKNYFLSSATWANVLANTRRTTFGPNDWHNVYLGIEALGPLDFSANAWSAFPLNPVADDIVSGKIASFYGDSLQLYCQSGEVDAFAPTKDAQVCFRDSARGLALGCHKEGEAFKTVFLSFDYRFLFTGPQFWITYHYDNLLGRVFEWFGTPVSQVSEKKAALPAVFRLNQNYPNPFNSQTVIDYCILKPAKVQLTIFNLAGERVTTLIDEHQAAHNYRIVWKAGGCPSGIYFCRLEVDGLSQTSKMIIVN